MGTDVVISPDAYQRLRKLSLYNFRFGDVSKHFPGSLPHVQLIINVKNIIKNIINARYGTCEKKA